MVDMTRLQFAASASNVTGSSADVRRSIYQNTTSELWTNTIVEARFKCPRSGHVQMSAFTGLEICLSGFQLTHCRRMESERAGR